MGDRNHTGIEAGTAQFKDEQCVCVVAGKFVEVERWMNVVAQAANTVLYLRLMYGRFSIYHMGDGIARERAIETTIMFKHELVGQILYLGTS